MGFILHEERKNDQLKKALKKRNCPVTGIELGKMFSISVVNC